MNINPLVSALLASSTQAKEVSKKKDIEEQKEASFKKAIKNEILSQDEDIVSITSINSSSVDGDYIKRKETLENFDFQNTPSHIMPFLKEEDVYTQKKGSLLDIKEEK